MATIFIKDDLRAAVEAASGGRQTVLYTAKGQPSYMNVIPKFMLEDVADVAGSLGVGVHPAFIVNGIEKSEFFYGTYQGVIKNGELLSLPNVGTTRGGGFDSCVNAARANGAGWHIGSNAEWAAIMLWCHKNGFTPRGNTNYGRSGDAPYETARRVDGATPGSISTAAILNGSGPASWRHDNSAGGISDMVGNIWEWQSGLRVVEGELQIIPNNDAATADLSSGSAAWKAIRLSDGALVAPGTAGTAKFDSPTDTTVGIGGAPMLSTSIIYRNGAVGDNTSGPGVLDSTFNSSTTAVGVTVPALLLALGVYRHKDVTDGDRIYVRNYGERQAVRGGSWGNGVGAGIRALSLASAGSSSGGDFGARPAFVL